VTDRTRHLFRPLLATALSGVLAGCLPPSLPETPPVTETRWLEQNWKETDRRWYHHASQGTSTLPVSYKWFLALEQPRLWLTGEPPLFSDPAYLARFGFIPPDDPAADAKIDRLPVGFALTSGKDPDNDKTLPEQIGFTCAACHTGHLEYRGTSLRIDGAPAMADLGKFRETLKLALAYTRYIPGRFDRFADRVLKDKSTDKAERNELWDDLVALIAVGKMRSEETAEIDALAVEEGFGRLDALNRIGNEVFFTDLRGRGDFEAYRGNYATHDAPVSFPPLWDTPWFEWVQYDGSIMQPMVRNAGEALGVRAKVNLKTPGEKLFASLVDVEQIDWMERRLAGDKHPTAAPAGFKGLRM